MKIFTFAEMITYTNKFKARVKKITKFTKSINNKFRKVVRIKKYANIFSLKM